MKMVFYPKLAWTGIRKNKQLFTPYILTCIGIIMMLYIIASLADSSLLRQVRGGSNVQQLLGFGSGVIGVFAVIFLFYTNSFLSRRRKKEFGLYNILGMDKKNIGRILLWETVMICGISIGVGLLGGLMLSKLAELGLFNILDMKPTYTLTVVPSAIWQVLVIFLVIFTLIFLKTWWQVRLSSPIALLRSENIGEKPPKANWVMAVIGVVILGVAYFLAVTIKNPVAALGVFFVAVLMVIVATYLLFVAGSVALCRILQKNKGYYYKPQNFVSISSMVYRMKRNGAGLASICILSTMVLVMLTSTASLYAGTEDTLNVRYPRDITLTVTLNGVEGLQDDNIAVLREIAVDAIGSQSTQNVVDYTAARIMGYKKGDYFETDHSKLSELDYVDMIQIYLVPLKEYNRIMGASELLEPDEALIYSPRQKYTDSTITIGEAGTLQVKGVLKEFFDGSMDNLQMLPGICVVIPNLDEYVQPLLNKYNEYGSPILGLTWYYGFDMDAPDDVHTQVLSTSMRGYSKIYDDNSNDLYSYYGESKAEQSYDLFTTFGGLLFLGIMLSLVFIFAAVLIIYYKQVSEGHEDRARFNIMQKVGMTKREIRKSINTQVLIVFFLPLVFAGMHLAFAFPMVWKLLQILNLQNLQLFVVVTVICFLIFCVFYALVYKLTARLYYNIVSGTEA